MAVLKVKLEDRSEENVYVYFDPALYRESWENQLRVKSIRVRFLDSDTRTQILCKQAVVEGMEKSFFGIAYASEHLDKIGKSEIEIDYMSSDATRRIATYVATGKATVDIYYDYNESIRGNFGDDWRAVYKISSN